MLLNTAGVDEVGGVQAISIYCQTELMYVCISVLIISLLKVLIVHERTAQSIVTVCYIHKI